MSRENPQDVDQDLDQGIEQEVSEELTLEQLEEHIGAAGRLHHDLSSRLEATARD